MCAVIIVVLCMYCVMMCKLNCHIPSLLNKVLWHTVQAWVSVPLLQLQQLQRQYGTFTFTAGLQMCGLQALVVKGYKQASNNCPLIDKSFANSVSAIV